MTPRQLETLDFICAFIAEHRYAPTLDEIGARFGKSRITILQRLVALERGGFIRRKRYASRHIDVLEKPAPPGACPTCGRTA